MAKKLGQRLINNFGLKVLAILFAVVLWIVVVNIDDPTKTVSYTTSVSLENTSYLTSMGKYYEVLDGNNTVTFRVTAKRSVHDKLSNSDFSAVANMEKIEYDEQTETYQVPVTITLEKNNTDVEISTKQNYIELALEDLSEIQKVISAVTKGTVADGCALGDVSIASYNVIKISGPASIVSLIDTVTATINVDGVDRDVTDSVTPVLYDADGNVVDTTKLTMSLKTVSIKAEVLATRDVPVQFSTTGTVADGYKVTGITYSPTEVRVKGENSALNAANYITVPAEVLDLTDISESLTKEVTITDYLPTGTSLVLSTDGKITVTVTVEPVMTKKFEVPVKNILVENLPEDCELEYEESTVTVELTGTEDAMSGMRASDITGVLDVSGLSAGTHLLPISWNLDQDDYSIEDESVIVTIVNTQDSGEGEETSGDGDSDDDSDAAADENEGTTAGREDAAGDDTDNAQDGDTADDAAGGADEAGDSGAQDGGVAESAD